MASTLKSLGLENYLNALYHKSGGYDRFVRLIKDGWTGVAIAREFGVSRQTVVNWQRMLEVKS